MNNMLLAINTAIEQYCDGLEGILSGPTRDALIVGGHRFRPLLTMLWADGAQAAIPYGVSVELVHTMSLIHDDLPCMDNAETRRGQPSCHVTYGEATAVLTGDLLLSEAFRILSETDKSGEAIRVLSRAIAEMAEGQAKEFAPCERTVESWLAIHKGKTGALLGAACELGAIASEQFDKKEQAREFGLALGIGYQLKDDLRDGDGITLCVEREEVERMANEYYLRCMNLAPNDRLRRMVDEVFG